MPDTLEEMVRQRTPSAPSSAACWKAAWKAPGEGAAVWGRSPLPRQRSQNSAEVSWRRSSNSSVPKRMVSGTTVTLCSLTSSSVRSQALSVTMWTPGMQGFCHGRPGGWRFRVVVVVCAWTAVGRGVRGRRWRAGESGAVGAGDVWLPTSVGGDSVGRLAPTGCEAREANCGSERWPAAGWTGELRSGDSRADDRAAQRSGAPSGRAGPAGRVGPRGRRPVGDAGGRRGAGPAR